MSFGTGLPRAVPGLTWQSNPQVDRVIAAHGPPGSMVVDLGAGGRRVAPHVVTVDAVRLPGTDIVADVCSTPFPTGSVDLVIATGLLEHVDDERRVLDECRRILKCGGTLHCEVPFLQHYHEDPIDCRRYTEAGLVLLLKQHGFSAKRSGHHIGPTVTLIVNFSYYIALLFEGPSRLNRVLSNGAFVLSRYLTWPFRYLDYWLAQKPSAHRLAFGVYCTATRLP